MKLIMAKNEDKEAVKKLWKYCFTDTDEYSNYYFDKRYNRENNYLIKVGDSVKVSLMANPYKISINNNISDTAYIVGVSSDVTARGKGFASKLIKHTLKDRYGKGEEVSMLMPIDTTIYTRYGYANISDMLELDIPINRINFTRQKDIELKEYSEELISDLIYIYDNYSNKFYSYFIRNEDYFKTFIEETYVEDGHIYIAYRNDVPVAYILFYPKYKTGETGFVKEIIALEKAGYDKLFELIKSHYTQMTNVIVNTDVHSYIPNYFMNDNKIVYKHKPFMMSRILNVKSIFANLNSKEKFLINIKDDIIEDNNNTFEVSELNVEIVDKKCNFNIDIYDFTQLYFSYVSIDNVIMKNNLKLDEKEYMTLKNIFASKKINYFNDYV